MSNSIYLPYTELRNVLGEATLRPILKLDIAYQGSLIHAPGLVDSGADVNVLPYRVGIELGLTWGEQRYQLRLSGNLADYDTRVVVLPVTVGNFAPIDLAFAWTKAEAAPLILGQTNFFQTFDVCFFRSDAHFTVTLKE